jgi:hypothetical protein
MRFNGRSTRRASETCERRMTIFRYQGERPEGLKATFILRPRLRKLACSAELLRINEGLVQVRVTTTGHSCGSSTKDIRAIVEDGVYEFAPDVAALEIIGLEEPSSVGFVALESLLGHRLVLAAPNGHSLQTEGTS